MREVPQPDYDYDVNKIQKAYTKALTDVQNELNNLFLTDFERAQIIVVEKNIRNILSDIEKYGNEWAAVAITKSATEGIASTIYTLELTKSYEEALKIVKFNTVNKQLTAAAIADTQSDLLAITQNMERQAKVAIRKATVEAMRAKLANGINATSDISKEIRERIINATGVAIIDARGNRWKIEIYADVVARTNMMNAHREASINEALLEESYYGRISRHGAKDACREYEGKIVKLAADAPGDYPYIGDIPRSKLFHPNCKHLVTPLLDPGRYESELSGYTGVGKTGKGIPLEEVKPYVLEEIYWNDAGAYGYLPKPGSKYAKSDFTDMEKVEKNRAIREEYLKESDKYQKIIDTMKQKGKTSAEIADVICNIRNQDKVAARAKMLPEEVARLEKRNMELYNDPVGPSAEWVFNKNKRKMKANGLTPTDEELWQSVFKSAVKKDDVVNTLLGIKH